MEVQNFQLFLPLMKKTILSIRRALEDGDSSPPCMGEVFRCLGKAARAALCAIARHLRLRSE